jgi:hypothetical protein
LISKIFTDKRGRGTCSDTPKSTTFDNKRYLPLEPDNLLTLKPPGAVGSISGAEKC